jgi:hypothetical protein
VPPEVTQFLETIAQQQIVLPEHPYRYWMSQNLVTRIGWLEDLARDSGVVERRNGTTSLIHHVMSKAMSMTLSVVTR